MMNTIGIVGGVGPHAGLDLCQKILDQTDAKTDQQHLPVVMLSLPHLIKDRTDYLIGKSTDNPAVHLARIINQLYEYGASVVGIPCNTAHADPIFGEIIARVSTEVTLLNLIDEVVLYIHHTYPLIKNIGILSTTGSFNAAIYSSYLSKYHLNAVEVTKDIQEEYIHPAIYDQHYGIKSNPASLKKAKDKLHYGADFLIKNGAQAIILGCTELPLIFTETHIDDIPLIDSTKILARSLILESNPSCLIR